MLLLRMGDKGQLVKQVQAALGQSTLDGVFGRNTAAMVVAHQRLCGLIPDGVVGPATWAALPGGGPVLGCDVSHYQGTVDWRALAKNDVRFAWAKATQGAGYLDPTFARNRDEAGLAPVALGAYHFANLGDAAKEADHLLRALGRLRTGELAPALDLESAPADWSAARLEDWAAEWLARVHAGLGVRPVLYTFEAFLAARLNGAPALARAGWPLWIARYRGAGAVDPGPVSKFPRWACWQWTQRGHLDGLGPAVDLDWMASAADLAALTCKE